MYPQRSLFIGHIIDAVFSLCTNGLSFAVARLVLDDIRMQISARLYPLQALVVGIQLIGASRGKNW